LRTLCQGATGADVIELQSTLLILGYNPEEIDGIFGVKTASAVIQFQKDNGLFPDEVVGPITWGYLQRLIASHQIYIIQPGDTFYKIALAFGIPLSELLAINVGIEPYELRVGQMIQLPKNDFPTLDGMIHSGDPTNANFARVKVDINLVLPDNPLGEGCIPFASYRGLYAVDRENTQKLYVIDPLSNRIKWEFTIDGNRPISADLSQAYPTEITVSAAASLQNSLTELQKYYALIAPNLKLNFNFGASGALQQQIEQGAPVDLFISAGKVQMDALEEKHLLVNDSRIILLGNDLVLISGNNHSKITSLEDLTKATVSRISIGTPNTVPAGQYAQTALTNLKLWDSLQPKFVLAKDVTSVLNYVETGHADAGFVYHTDAQGSTQVKVIAVVPASSHQPIIYPAAVISTTKNQQAARNFLNYLQSPEAQQVFARYGFKTLEH